MVSGSANVTSAEAVRVKAGNDLPLDDVFCGCRLAGLAKPRFSQLHGFNHHLHFFSPPRKPLIDTYSRQLSHLSFLFLSYFRFLLRFSFFSLGVLRFETRQVLAIYPTAMSSSKDPQSNIPASSKGSWSSFLKVSALLHIRIGEPCAPGRKL